MAYGAGVAKIAQSTGIPEAEVQALADAEDARYPEIAAYFVSRTAEIGKNRRPTNKVVPHPEFPHIMCQLGVSTVTTPDGKRYTYVESPAMAYQVKRGQFTSFSPTEIKNYEVQGGGGEWMKAAMWLGVREFYRTGNFDGLALLVNTVHDATYADAHETKRLEVGVMLQACMEAASDFMEWFFSWPLPLPVPTDTVYGKNMGEEIKFTDPEFKAQVREARAAIRQRYMNGHMPSYLKDTA